MTNASRAPIDAQVDLDALAHDLRREAGRSPHEDAAHGETPHKADPLAELARIVGQDDPFRALLAARDGGRTAPAAHQPAAHQPAWDGRVEPSFAPEAAPKPTPADAFDQYLASVEQDTHDASAHAAPDAAPETYEEGRALRRANPRRRLASVGVGIGIVAVAVAGALTYKGLHRTGGGGGVPVVQADSTPLKVAPKVADGVEIPDQNRQIYDAKSRTKDGQIRIVNREEQPLDVAQAARAAQGSGQGAGAQAAGTTPGSGPFEAFGEPRRVRTVAVKPETPPAPRDPQADAATSALPTMTLPADEAPKPKPVRQAVQQPVQAAQPSAQAVPVQAPPSTTPAQAATAKPVAVKPPPKAAQRVAAVAPDATTAQTAVQDAPDTTATTGAAPAGSFSVQLGVRSSAEDARAALRQMQAKYGQLAGKPELIRQAEVNGKTIYRVRVGPLAKAEAAGLCSALQGEGGQCFVAKN